MKQPELHSQTTSAETTIRFRYRGAPLGPQHLEGRAISLGSAVGLSDSEFQAGCDTGP